MKLVSYAIALLLLICTSIPSRAISPESVDPAARVSIVIKNVSVIDTESGSASSPQDVFIAGDLITAVAPAGSLSIPIGTTHIDGTGRFAMPGLIDVHAHIGEGGIAPASPVTRERALRQFLRYGVTTIFIPGATGASDADLPELRKRCRATLLQCPGIYGSGSLITALGSHPVSTIFRMPNDTPAEILETRGVTILKPEDDVAALIDRKKALGVDAIKIIVEDGPPPWYPKPKLSDQQVRSIVKAAHASSLPVYSHVSTAAHVEILLDAGADGIMHAPTDRMSDTLLRRMSKQRMWYVPTFSLYDGILTWARKQGEGDPYALKGVEPSAIKSLTAPPFLEAAAEDEAAALEYLANASDNIRRAAAAGVLIALGTDVSNPFVFPGYSAHEELVWMVRAGLSPKQALRAGTIGGASFLGKSLHIGRIAVGFEADIVLVSANPLESIESSRSIVAVLSDGKLVADVVGVH